MERENWNEEEEIVIKTGVRKEVVSLDFGLSANPEKDVGIGGID